MADEQYVIEVGVETKDQTEPGLSNAERRVTQFQNTLRTTEEQIRRLNDTKIRLIASAIDRASGTFDRVEARALRLTRKSYDIVVRVKDYATAPLRAISDLANSYATYITLAAGGAAAYGGIVWPLKLADNMQKAQIGFEGMMKSAKKAQQFMQQVQNFAIQTPFDTQDVIKNANFMMALGFQAKQIIPMLTAIGDAVSNFGGGADEIQRIVLALGQMRAHGKVDAGDMLQLTEANINGWQYIADAMHKSVSEVQKLSAAGKLEAVPAINAIVAGMEKTFGGSMERNANRTLSGILSQIQDTFDNRIVLRWGQGLQVGAMQAFQKLNNWINNNQKDIKGLGDQLEQLGRDFSTWVEAKAEEAMRAVNRLFNSRAWQQADTFGEKLKVAWDQIIVVPFDNWWNGKGQQQVAHMAAEVGNFFGSMLNGLIMGALGFTSGKPIHHKMVVDAMPSRLPHGSLVRHLAPDLQREYSAALQKANVHVVDSQPWIDAGQTAGTAFFNAFAKAFNADQIAHKLVQAFGNIQPSFLGGNTQSAGGDALSILLDLWLLNKGWKLGREGVRRYNETRSVIKAGRRWIDRVKNAPWIRRGRPPRGGETGGPKPTGAVPATDGPKLSGLLDPHGRPLPSAIAEAEQVASKAGWLSKVRGIARRIPFLNTVLGGMDAMTALRAPTKEEKFEGVGGSVGSTIGSSIGGALGALVPIPGLDVVTSMAGSMLGDFVGGKLGSGIGRLLSRVKWSAITKGMSGAIDHVKSFKNDVSKHISETASNITKHLSTVPDRVTTWFAKMRDGAVQKWTAFREDLGKIAGGIWATMAGPLQNAVNGVVGFVNSIIKAVNWVASKFGLSTVPLLSGVALVGGGSGGSGGGSGGTAAGGGSGGQRIAAFAKGVTDWKGGLALVGEEGPELVYLPPHSSVLPHQKTRKLIPGFKNGVGTFFDKAGDVLSLLVKGPKALAQAAMNAFAKPPHLPGVLSGLGSALMKWATNGLVSWVNKHLPKISFGGGGAVADRKQVAGWLMAALQATGTPASWLPGLLKLVGAESSGNPAAVNPQPVGGQHATGLLQMLPSTFKEYSIGGSIWNPVANAAAAIRYIQARYGSVYNTPLFKGGPYKGYAKGGVINEPIVGIGLSTHTKYLMGERGPEKITPLHKDTPLTVPVRGGGNQINVSLGGVTLAVSVDGGDPQEILQVLRENTDDLALEIAVQLEKIFSNLPHQKGA
jgi:tape measure domain-containing protein